MRPRGHTYEFAVVSISWCIFCCQWRTGGWRMHIPGDDLKRLKRCKVFKGPGNLHIFEHRKFKLRCSQWFWLLIGRSEGLIRRWELVAGSWRKVLLVIWACELENKVDLDLRSKSWFFRWWMIVFVRGLAVPANVTWENVLLAIKMLPREMQVLQDVTNPSNSVLGMLVANA